MKPYFATLLLAYLTCNASAHDHFEAGVIDANGNSQPDQGEALALYGPDPEARIFHLLARPMGQPGQNQGGYYSLSEKPRTLFPFDAFSLIVQSDGQYDIAGENHPHTGALIAVEIVSVSGPSGGVFGFWDEGASEPSYSFSANQPTQNERFILSEGGDASGEDPLGHIHGRAWTATKAGEYLVGLRLVDISTNAPNGQPWHAPSRVYQFRFAAGPEFRPAVQHLGTTVSLTWPSRMGVWDEVNQPGIQFRIERMKQAPATGWETIGTVQGTTADTVQFTDSTPHPSSGIYRLAYQWAMP
jgi:hypothetical protein